MAPAATFQGMTTVVATPVVATVEVDPRIGERLDDRGEAKLLGLLEAGDPGWSPPSDTRDQGSCPGLRGSGACGRRSASDSAPR